ncbi:MAG: pseudouridine synthase [Pirellulales bacterium]|nr:pseudouridine synthase [Pirellulales bacterium]
MNRRHRPHASQSTPESPAIETEAAPPQPERLQKVLASAGVGSRRHCEEIITAGRVSVDGQVVTELGTRVVWPGQKIVVDDTTLKPPKLVYYAVFKPEGVVSTNYDPDGRARVIDLLPDHVERVFSVGRLDRASEGLMLLTNDGELAQKLTHPRFGVEKTYEVLIAGRVDAGSIDRLLRGVHLAEGIAKVAHLEVKSRRPQSTLVRMVLREGRNREIRRVLARVGHKALKIKRIAIAGLRLGNLKPGQFRRLTPDEVRELKRAAAGKQRQRRQEAAPAPGPPQRAKRPARPGQRSSAARPPRREPNAGQRPRQESGPSGPPRRPRKPSARPNKGRP